MIKVSDFELIKRMRKSLGLYNYRRKIHGSALLEDISKVVGVALSDDEYDTFNGLIFHALETVPEDGTDIELEIAGLHIKVAEIEEHQVETAIVEKVNIAS